MRIVIIGNSATAVGAIETIRQHDQRAQIDVVTEEGPMIYSRPLLSHYLAGQIDRQGLSYRSSDFYCKHDVHAILDTRVERIEPRNHRILDAQGKVYPYDKLLISTGGKPILPPVEEAEGIEGVYTFTRRADADAMLARLRQRDAGRVVLVGGGMIGIKAADAFLERGLQVTMVELAPRILGAALDETGSELMTRALEANGVAVRTENTVESVEGEGGEVTAVHLRSGETIPCDLLVFGIGVRPNTDPVSDSGIAVNRGIVVDRAMRTSAPDVYAAGDVAEAYDLIVDMNRTVAIWPNAYRQGAIAGADMVGVPSRDRGGVAMNALKVGDVSAMAVGDGAADEDEDGCEVLSELDRETGSYKRLVLRGDRLVGAILVNDIRRAGIYTGLIRGKIAVDDVRDTLLDDRFGLLSLPDHYRKHIVTGVGIEV